MPPDLDWTAIGRALDQQGWAVTRPVLDKQACAALRAGWETAENFRSRVVMQRHGFGAGEYRYYADPLPDTVQQLRTALYPPLARIANAWEGDGTWPPTLAECRARCAAAGQARPTPLLLRYGAGDYNCLHQDLYGDLVFPLQAAFLLSDPATEFAGGEFVLTEQRPRMQSRVAVVPLRQGEAVIFPVRHRPVQGTRGRYRVQMRHGVSVVRSGTRFTLGIIFHDSK